MHELALMTSLVDTIAEQLDQPAEAAEERPRKVTVVRLAIGALAGVAVEPLRFAFDACAEGTPLEGARLEIRAIEARARCSACGSEQPAVSLAAPCSCGSFDRVLLSGDELRLENVEVV